MKSTHASYNDLCDYDLDHEINLAVEETKKFIKRLKYKAENDSDAKAILEAISSEMLEAIKKMGV